MMYRKMFMLHWILERVAVQYATYCGLESKRHFWYGTPLWPSRFVRQVMGPPHFRRQCYATSSTPFTIFLTEWH